MLGFQSLSNPPPSLPSIPSPKPPPFTFTPKIHPLHLSIPRLPLNPRKLTVQATDQRNENRNGKELNNGNGNGNEEDLKKENGRPTGGFNLKWGQLLLDPDPDNVLAVGLTGLLTWASVQVVWQLLAVSLAIVVAGLKYSIVAALLIFILIALL